MYNTFAKQKTKEKHQMTAERTYVIAYLNFDGDTEKRVCVQARYATEAYDKLMRESGWNKYAAWVDSYIKRNGEKHYFNNFAGKPY